MTRRVAGRAGLVYSGHEGHPSAGWHRGGHDPQHGERRSPVDELLMLRAEVAYLRAVLACASDAVVASNEAGAIVEFNEGAVRATGYTKAEAVGRPVSFLYAEPEERARILEALRRQPDGPPGTPAGRAVQDVDVMLRRKDGTRVWFSLSLAELRDEGGRAIGTVGIAKDITERRRLEGELRRLSMTDKLTGLYNQSYFYRTLEVEKERAARLRTPLSLVMFDLDRFKDWNDRRGHAEGDRALRAVGGVIFAEIRKEVDSGFRYGGDEFCVLLPGSDAEGALAFAERLRAGIERLNLDGITASLGVARHEPRRQVVKQADQAMYRAKRAGCNRICVEGRPGLSYARGAPARIAEDAAVAAREVSAVPTSLGEAALDG